MNTTLKLVAVNDEQRILDFAKRLVMEIPRKIRSNLIAPNLDELRELGNLDAINPNAGKRGRPASCYYLNEEHALLFCLLFCTARPFARK